MAARGEPGGRGRPATNTFPVRGAAPKIARASSVRPDPTSPPTTRNPQPIWAGGPDLKARKNEGAPCLEETWDSQQAGGPPKQSLGDGKLHFPTTNLPEIMPQIAILKVRTYNKRPRPGPLFSFSSIPTGSFPPKTTLRTLTYLLDTTRYPQKHRVWRDP